MTHTSSLSRLHVWDRRVLSGHLQGVRNEGGGIGSPPLVESGRCTFLLLSLYLCLLLRMSCFPEDFICLYSQNRWNTFLFYLDFLRNKSLSHFFVSLSEAWHRSGVLPDLTSLREVSSLEGKPSVSRWVA